MIGQATDNDHIIYLEIGVVSLRVIVAAPQKCRQHSILSNLIHPVKTVKLCITHTASASQHTLFFP